MTIKIATRVKLIAVILAFSAAVTLARGQAAFKDDFSAPVNYLSNGVAGTIWDGIYLGAGEIARPMGIWMGPGSVSVADAGITKPGTLSISSLQTDWENDSDDGVFFFKVITGDFDMSVEVVGPIDSRAHNFPGLMVRAFGTNGAPSADGKENFLVWARFDEYSIANMLKNETDGKKRDTREGTYPNSNYWLRIQRAGNEFKLSEKASAGDAWSQVGSVTRADFAGRPLQVGIEHADFDGGRTLKAAYRNFSLTLSNMGPFAAAPLPPTNLKVTAKKPDGHVLTWAPGGESTGSVAVVWTGNELLKEAPADGMTYTGAAGYGLGDSLPGLGYYVVHAGKGRTVTVTNLPAGTNFNVAVFSYAGSGKSIAYSHVPVTTAVKK